MSDTDYLLELLGPDAIDLGGGHWARLQTKPGSDKPTGFLHVHPSGGGNHIPAGQPCAGAVDFDRWALISLKPLHVEPSLLCSCGSHGFVRNGRWEGV